MNEPRRLSEAGDVFEQALLGSARRDYGSSTAQARCIAAATATAGIVAHAAGAAAATAPVASVAASSLEASTAGAVGASTAGAVGTSTAGASAVGASTAVANTALGSSSAIASIAAKGVAIGLALGLSVQGAVVVSRQFSKPQASQTVASGQVLATPRGSAHSGATPQSSAIAAAAAVGEGEGQGDQHDDAAPLSSASPRPNARASLRRDASEERTQVETPEERTLVGKRAAVASSSADSVGSNALEREVALIDEARLVCRARDYEYALVLIERYEREFVHGALLPESLVIRTQALVGLGRNAEAERFASPFMARNESSPITRRLRAILNHAQPTP